MHKLVIDTEWSPDDISYIRQKLRDYNIKHLSQKDVDFVGEVFSFILKDEDGKILGGISGKTKMQSLEIQFLWIDESLRGNGIGEKLIKRVESFAVEKGCRMIKLDTFSFQAPDFYKRLGFEIYGKIEDFPEGYDHYFLYKKI